MNEDIIHNSISDHDFSDEEEQLELIRTRTITKPTNNLAQEIASKDEDKEKDRRIFDL